MHLIITRILPQRHLIAVSRFADNVACQRTEVLLANIAQGKVDQIIPSEFIENLLSFMEERSLLKRYARLATLLSKLMTNDQNKASKYLTDTKSQHPLHSVGELNQKSIIDKELVISIVQFECSKRMPNFRDCALMLSCLEYADIVNILMSSSTHQSIIGECLRAGAELSLASYDENCLVGGKKNYSGDESRVPLFRAAELCLIRKISEVVSDLPAPHEVSDKDIPSTKSN